MQGSTWTVHALALVLAGIWPLCFGCSLHTTKHGYVLRGQWSFEWARDRDLGDEATGTQQTHAQSARPVSRARDTFGGRPALHIPAPPDYVSGDPPNTGLVGKPAPIAFTQPSESAETATGITPKSSDLTTKASEVVTGASKVTAKPLATDPESAPSGDTPPPVEGYVSGWTRLRMACGSLGRALLGLPHAAGTRTRRHKPAERVVSEIVGASPAAYYNHPRFHPVPTEPAFTPRSELRLAMGAPEYGSGANATRPFGEGPSPRPTIPEPEIIPTPVPIRESGKPEINGKASASPEKQSWIFSSPPESATGGEWGGQFGANTARVSVSSSR